jgi:hypothetical protein|tara:strand:+ start:1696 stop:2037 length:342 start_codon:yes stop_codon:yes gene_type:complete
MDTTEQPTENPTVEEESPAEAPVEDSVESPDSTDGEQTETPSATTSGFEIKTPDGNVHSVDDLKRLGAKAKDELAAAAKAPAAQALGDWIQMGVDGLKGAVAGFLGERKKDDE